MRDSTVFGALSAISSPLQAASSQVQENYVGFTVMANTDESNLLKDVVVTEGSLAEFNSNREHNEVTSGVDDDLKPPPLDEDQLTEEEESGTEHTSEQPISCRLRKRHKHKSGGFFPSNPDLLFDWSFDDSSSGVDENDIGITNHVSASSAFEKELPEKIENQNENSISTPVEKNLGVTEEQNEHIQEKMRTKTSSNSDTDQCTPANNCSEINQNEEEFSKIQSVGLKLVLKRKKGSLTPKYANVSSVENDTISIRKSQVRLTDIRAASASPLKHLIPETLQTADLSKQEKINTNLSPKSHTLKEQAFQNYHLSSVTETRHQADNEFDTQITTSGAAEVTRELKNSEENYTTDLHIIDEDYTEKGNTALGNDTVTSLSGNQEVYSNNVRNVDNYTTGKKNGESKKKTNRKDKIKDPPARAESNSSTENAEVGMRLTLEFTRHNWLEKQLVEEMKLQENSIKVDSLSEIESPTNYKETKPSPAAEEGKALSPIVSPVVSGVETVSSSYSSLMSEANSTSESGMHMIGIVKPFQRCEEPPSKRAMVVAGQDEELDQKKSHFSSNGTTEKIKSISSESSEKAQALVQSIGKDSFSDVNIENYYSLAVYPARRSEVGLDLTSKDRKEPVQYDALDLTKKHSRSSSSNCGVTKDVNTTSKSERLKEDFQTTDVCQKISSNSNCSVYKPTSQPSKPFVVFSSGNGPKEHPLTPRLISSITNENLQLQNKLKGKQSLEGALDAKDEKLYNIVREGRDTKAVDNPSSKLSEVYMQPPSTESSILNSVNGSFHTTLSFSNKLKGPEVKATNSTSKQESQLVSKALPSHTLTSNKARQMSSISNYSKEKRKPSTTSFHTDGLVIDVDAFEDDIAEIHPRMTPKIKSTPACVSSAYKINLQSTSCPQKNSRRTSQQEISTFPVPLQSRSTSVNGLLKEVEKEVQRKEYPNLGKTEEFSRNIAKKHIMPSYRHKTGNYAISIPEHIVCPQSVVQTSNPQILSRVVLENRKFYHSKPIVGNFSPRKVVPQNGGTIIYQPTAPLLSPHSRDLQRHQRTMNVLQQTVKPQVPGYIPDIPAAFCSSSQYPASSPMQKRSEQVLLPADKPGQQYTNPIKPTPVRSQQVAYPARVSRYAVSSGAYIATPFASKTDKSNVFVANTLQVPRSSSRLVSNSNGTYLPRPTVVRAPPGGVSIDSTPIIRSDHGLVSQETPPKLQTQRDIKRAVGFTSRPRTPPGLNMMSREEATRFVARLNTHKLELEKKIREVQVLEKKIFASSAKGPEVPSLKHIHQGQTYTNLPDSRKRKLSSSQYIALPPHPDASMLTQYSLHQSPPNKVSHTVQPPSPHRSLGRSSRIEIEEKCGVCRKKAYFVCSGCRGIWYCSKTCQFDDWAKHCQTCA